MKNIQWNFCKKLGWKIQVKLVYMDVVGNRLQDEISNFLTNQLSISKISIRFFFDFLEKLVYSWLISNAYLPLFLLVGEIWKTQSQIKRNTSLIFRLIYIIVNFAKIT